MTNVLRVTEFACCSGYSHPCKWILYPCLGGQEPESWTDCIWLLLKAATELIFHANIIYIENSLECILNTHSAVITLVLVCPFCLFTLLPFPSHSFMTVTDEVCCTQSSNYVHNSFIILLFLVFHLRYTFAVGTPHHTTIFLEYILVTGLQKFVSYAEFHLWQAMTGFIYE
jgi:hypothetical protein